VAAAGTILTEKLAVVELCTCHGTPVDELRSSDAALFRFLAARESPTRLTPPSRAPKPNRTGRA
jgi:hypothetical protein